MLCQAIRLGHNLRRMQFQQSRQLSQVLPKESNQTNSDSTSGNKTNDHDNFPFCNLIVTCGVVLYGISAYVLLINKSWDSGQKELLNYRESNMKKYNIQCHYAYNVSPHRSELKERIYFFNGILFSLPENIIRSVFFPVFLFDEMILTDDYRFR